jgi:MFS family permease
MSAESSSREEAAAPGVAADWLVPLISSYIGLHACMTGARLAAPLATLQLGGNEFEVGLLLALFSAAAVVLAFPAGRFADRHGLRPTLRIAAGVALFGTLCVVIRPSLLTLAVAALCSGSAVTVGLVGVQRYAGRAARDAGQRKIAFSWLAVGPAISSFAGPFSTGFMLDHLGLRGAFAVLSLINLLPLLLVQRVTELPPVEPRDDDAQGGTLELFRVPGVLRLFLVNWLLSMAWDVHTFVVPVFGHERGMSASLIGSVAGAFAVAAICVRIALPFAAPRLKERDVLIGAMIVAAVIYALYPFAPAAWAMMGLSFLLGLALGCVQPMVMSALHRLTPEHRHGEALGLRLTVLNLSSATMPLLFGALGAAAGVAAVFWISAAALGGGQFAARRLELDEEL